jgi:hypothetical protein
MNQHVRSWHRGPFLYRNIAILGLGSQTRLTKSEALGRIHSGLYEKSDDLTETF